MGFQISLGLPDAMRDQAAALYWEAFGGKLGRVMGPDKLALAFLADALCADHALVACNHRGRLLGIAGFKSYDGSFAGGDVTDMRRVYGRWGAAWRAGLLWLLQREVDNDRFLLDGICVAREARSQGIGSALMLAMFDEARARGYSAIRLDVIDTNWRARALYERLGFQALRVDKMGPLGLIFGFSSSTTMVRNLE